MKGEFPAVDHSGIEKSQKPANDNGSLEKPERAEKGEQSDLIALDDFLKEAGETMSSVVQALERERGYAAEVRKMGARVTRETSQKIADLEKQRNRLEQEVDEAAHDLAFINWVSAKREQGNETPPMEMKKLRTPELDELLNDPDSIDITDDMVVEVQSEVELKILEQQLQEEADNAQFEMADLIEQLHEMKKSAKKPEPPKWDPELRKSLRDILSTRAKELEDRIAELSKPEPADMDEIDQYYARQRAQELERSKKEMSQVFAQGLEMDTASIEENAGPTEAEHMDNMLAGVLEARFNELQNYTRVLKEKIKDVRVDLGLVKGLGGNADMKKAA
jgi:hypothetical protein